MKYNDPSGVAASFSANAPYEDLTGDAGARVEVDPVATTTADGNGVVRPQRSPRAVPGGTGGTTAENVIAFPAGLKRSVPKVFGDVKAKVIAFEDYAGINGANWFGLAVIVVVLWFLWGRKL